MALKATLLFSERQTNTRHKLLVHKRTTIRYGKGTTSSLRRSKSAITHKGITSREITRRRIMLMPSGRHVVAAKSSINYSLQFFYCLVCYPKTQDASQLPCSASFHSCSRCCSVLRKWWQEDKKHDKYERNSTDTLNAVVSRKSQVLVRLTLRWGVRKKFCSLWGIHVHMLLHRQAAKMEKTYHNSGFIPLHKHIKWDHNIYDLF